MTVDEALRHGATMLRAAGIESARREARLLLGEAAGLSQEALLRDPDRRIDPARYQTLLERRAAREPLAFILGWQEFWSLRFRVSPATLIPRADSETLVEAALAARPEGVASVLDLGTGTGCLLLAILSEFRGAWGVGTDRNKEAARLAQANARALGLADRAAFVCADWAAPIGARFDLVLSNPPYVPSAEVAGLMPEVARFEPVGALDGGPDGLDAYRAVLAELPRLVRPGGLAVLELGLGQAGAVAALARETGFGRISTRRDLAGIERALLIEAGANAIAPEDG
ncbi:MAG TPA: peptide chain release factor N(5)-glutamine methyltransferase [Acetobacteraceae bacterium]|nr:peptide chain release factor N(5)-glutamine methyltransferase [Acetobacteraceae bacterium]